MSDLNQVLNNNSFYNNNANKIERPFAEADFSKLRWDQVLQIMQHQALAAKIQTMAKYPNMTNMMMPPPPTPPPAHMSSVHKSMPNDLIPLHIACDYSEIPFNYSTNMNGNPSSNSEESDSSSYCSSGLSSPETSEMSSSDTDTDGSDIEIDVEDCSDDNMESGDDYYHLMSTSPSNIPLTVLQLESELSKREMQHS